METDMTKIAETITAGKLLTWKGELERLTDIYRTTSNGWERNFCSHFYNALCHYGKDSNLDYAYTLAKENWRKF